jgi:LuxR family transcriptional regulator, quorum-sensing system regulator BjaR1
VPAAGEALELLNRIQTTQSKNELTEAMQHVAKRFGFRAFAISHYCVRNAEDCVDLLLAALPEAFGERFVTENYGGMNPISRRARQSDVPFYWHDVTYDRDTEPKAAKIMDEAAAAGLVDGFCIPVHMPEGGRGLVSFLGGPVTLSDDGRLALQALGLAGHAQVLHLATFDAGRTPKLTAREREVLRWTAAGKTADATAEILSISVRTVEYHLLNASRKLNTANRTHTVVEALRSRQLSL